MVRGMIRPVLPALLFSGMAMEAALGSSASVEDEKYLPSGEIGGLEVTRDQSVTQTFTVRRDGTLSRLEILQIRNYRCPVTEPLTIELHTTARGIPTDTVLVSRTVPASDVHGTVGLDIRDSQIDVAAEDLLAVTLSTQAPSDGCTYAWNGDGPGAYDRGVVFLQGKPNWFRDMGFRTMIVPFNAMEHFNPRSASSKMDGSGHDRFDFSADFALGAKNDGIDPAVETVHVNFGQYSQLIPPGSFSCAKGACTYRSNGPGVTYVSIDGGQIQVSASDVDLGGTANPAFVAVRIGDDRGAASVQLTGVMKQEGGNPSHP